MSKSTTDLMDLHLQGKDAEGGVLDVSFSDSLIDNEQAKYENGVCLLIQHGGAGPFHTIYLNRVDAAILHGNLGLALIKWFGQGRG